MTLASRVEDLTLDDVTHVHCFECDHLSEIDPDLREKNGKDTDDLMCPRCDEEGLDAYAVEWMYVTDTPLGTDDDDDYVIYRPEGSEWQYPVPR